MLQGDTLHSITKMLKYFIIYYGDITKLEFFENKSDNNGLYDIILKIPTPVFPAWKDIYRGKLSAVQDIFGGLAIAIHDIWGNYINIKNYFVKRDRYGTTFTGKLELVIYDNFGLDVLDIEKKYGYLGGFRSWFVLQHLKDYNGAYKPFVTVIKIEQDFWFRV